MSARPDLSFLPADLAAQFNESAEWLGRATTANVLNNDELLDCYKYYKQCTVGDNNQAAPGMLAFREKKKHERSYVSLGMPREAAARSYVETITRLKAAHPIA